MKRVLFLSLFLAMIPFVNLFAGERFRIKKILKEINPKQAEAYNPILVSTFTVIIDGYQVVKRYFIDDSYAPEQDSHAKVIESKSSAQPWLLSINGRNVYVEFRDDTGLRTGDKGVIRYDYDDLCLIID